MSAEEERRGEIWVVRGEGKGGAKLPRPIAGLGSLVHSRTKLPKEIRGWRHWNGSSGWRGRGGRKEAETPHSGSELAFLLVILIGSADQADIFFSFSPTFGAKCFLNSQILLAVLRIVRTTILAIGLSIHVPYNTQ